MNYATTLDRIDDLVLNEDWPNAESLILQARTRFGKDDPGLQRRLGEVALNAGSAQQAWDILESHPDSDLGINMLRSLAAFRSGRGRIGREWLESVLTEAGPEESDRLMDLSQSLYLIHQFDASSQVLRQILEMEPEDPDNLYEIHIGLALCEWILQSGREHDHAVAALEARPGDPLAMSLLGNALFDAGQREEGLALLDRVGIDQLLNLQCEEGAKRLFRWRRRLARDRDEIRELTRHMVAWEAERTWDPRQSRWVESCRDRIDRSTFLVDDPESDRLVGFSLDRGMSPRPLVNVAVSDRLRVRALEERSFLGIPVHVDKNIVERWYNHVGDKVVTEPHERFWEFVEMSSVVE